MGRLTSVLKEDVSLTVPHLEALSALRDTPEHEPPVSASAESLLYSSGSPSNLIVPLTVRGTCASARTP